MQTIIVTGAYGRDYKTPEQANVDFLADKDFLIQDMSCQWNGGYLNKADMEKYTTGPVTLKIRYNKLRDVCDIVVRK